MLTPHHAAFHSGRGAPQHKMPSAIAEIEGGNGQLSGTATNQSNFGFAHYCKRHKTLFASQAHPVAADRDIRWSSGIN